MLPYDEPRCKGHGAGPSGHQSRIDCANCARRLAFAPEGFVKWMEPVKEFPCPEKIRERVDG
jgi:hypothetical protein